jgi:hypothetical protein
MMKFLKLFLISIPFFLLLNESMATTKDSLGCIGSKLCKIEKIKRHMDVYIIYVSSGDELYKIVSLVEKNDLGEKIKIGKEYELMLFSYFSGSDTFHSILNFEVSPGNVIEADEKTRELYYTINLRGLKFCTENKLSNSDEPLDALVTINRIIKKRGFFIILASTEQISYKIISIEDHACNRNEIKIGNKYEITIQSYFNGQPWQVRYRPISYSVSPGKSVSVDPKTRDLFYTKNFKGLCYTRNTY